MYDPEVVGWFSVHILFSLLTDTLADLCFWNGSDVLNVKTNKYWSHPVSINMVCYKLKQLKETWRRTVMKQNNDGLESGEN